MIKINLEVKFGHPKMWRCINKIALLVTLCTFLGYSATAADYFWVGGAGNWSDINHWATSSGGTTKHAIVPSQYDDVMFDGNSGLLNNSIVVLPTGGHAYCRNINWAGVNTTAEFRNNGSFSLYVYGDMILSNSVKYGMRNFAFLGASNATLTINGAQRVNATGWYNPFEVNKPGASLTLIDGIPEDLQVSNITLTAGGLNLSNNNHTFWNLTSNNTNNRSLDISNANIFISENWNYRSSGMSIVSNNSLLTAAQVQTTNLEYNEIIVTVGSTNTLFSNTIINKLTFSDPTALPGTVRIGGNNLINRLNFMGGGCIRNNGNVIDSLVMAPGKAVLFFDTITIKEYFSINTPTCGGTGELYSTTSIPAVINFEPSVVFDWNNVLITRMTAASSVPITVPGADGGNTTNWNFTAPPAGATLYWVGGAGDWNDKAHWSATSGGAGGYCIPFVADNVIFDVNSGFTPTSKIVTTSANAWCKDMTWINTTNSPIFNENTSYTLEVWGSVVLDNAVTMNAELNLKGQDLSSLQSNGSALGNLKLIIDKVNPNGGITLDDNLINTNASIRLNSGKFLLPGKTLHIDDFVSSGGVRTLDITNATITTESRWSLTGQGRTWIGDAAGSSITANLNFAASGLTYPNILITSDIGSIDIAGVNIGKLNYSNTSPASTAKIASGNIIDSLIFSGAGFINSGITGNTINTLLLAPSKIYNFSGNTTINSLFDFVSSACAGLGEMRGINNATLSFGNSVIVNLNNAYVLDMTATGNVTPLSFSGANAGGNTGFNINSSSPENRYWIGGSGDWNDNSHWAATSGGPGGACIPTVNDNVFFDQNSFTLGSSTVTTTVGNAYSKNMDWTGAVNAPIFNKATAFDMELWGSLKMNPLVVMNGVLLFRGETNDTIFVNNSTLGDFDFNVLKEGGNLRVDGDFINNLSRIELYKGGLNLADNIINIDAISDLGVSTAHSLNITNATLNCAWNYSGNNKNLIADNSNITVPSGSPATMNGETYNIVDIKTANASYITINNATFNNLMFSNALNSSGARILANNIINYLEFKGSGNIAGSNNVIDTLVFTPGRVYSFANGTNTTINDAWFGSGTPCNLTEITSPLGATVNMISGNVEFDYARIGKITANGNTPFVALEHAVDFGGNINWSIAPYNGAAPIYGLGPDTIILSNDFPWELNTNGFFGSPLSQYLWNDNSTANNLIIADSGTYWVEVNFVDGCTVSDTILIGKGTPLPIKLIEFTAINDEDCNALLSWKTANAENFNNFIIERSEDGKNFKEIAKINYQDHLNQYQHLDKNAHNESLTFYRLKLMDLDGNSDYSKIIALNMDCNINLNAMKVYPNPRNQASSDLTVNANLAIKNITIISAAGEIVWNNTYESKNENITIKNLNLTSGTYLIRVEMENGSVQYSKLVNK